MQGEEYTEGGTIGIGGSGDRMMSYSALMAVGVGSSGPGQMLGEGEGIFKGYPFGSAAGGGGVRVIHSKVSPAVMQMSRS